MKKSRLLGAICACVFILTSLPLDAAIIDQNFDPIIRGGAVIGDGKPTDKAQTFTVGITGNLVQIDLLLSMSLSFPTGAEPTEGLVLNIRPASDIDSLSYPAESNSSTHLTTIIPGSDITEVSELSITRADFSWVTINLGEGIMVTAGDTLAIALSAVNSNETYLWGAAETPSYVNGKMYDRAPNIGDGTWFSREGDLAFKTYISTVPSSITVLIDNDTYTTDTRSGLDWLDLTETQNESFNYVTSQLGIGGVYEGWKYATEYQITSLFDSAGGTSPYTGTNNNDVVLPLINLWGETFNNTEKSYSHFLTSIPYDVGNVWTGYIFDSIVPDLIYDTVDYMIIQSSATGVDVNNLAIGSALTRVSTTTNVYVEPDSFADGANIINVYSGATLSVEGREVDEVFSVHVYDDFLGKYVATTGAAVFGNTPDLSSDLPNGQVWDEATYGLLRVDFDIPTDFVSIDLIYADDSIGRLSAYNSDGNILDSVTGQGDGRGVSSPFCPPFCDTITPVSIRRVIPDIAYILVGGVGADPVYLDNMKFNYSSDVDGDGVTNGDDNCPMNTNTNQTDSDFDGVGDLCDAFPFDPNETLDSDGDGVGDIADAFPFDPNETLDSDGDGVGDIADAFPFDPNETLDSDGDGVGNNADVFPFDPTRTINIIPVADAGLDVTVNLNDSVQLDGSGSNDMDGDALTYIWSFTSMPVGSLSTLSNATASNPVFTADIPGSYVLQLIVNDGLLNSAPDSVAIEAINLAPLLISQIPDQFAKECSEFGPLDVSTYFSDPEGDKLVFSIISGLPSSTGIEINADTGVISGAPTLFDAMNQPLYIRVSAKDGTSILNNTTDTFILNIEQANRGSVQLTSKTYSVQEDEGFATINLERVGGSDCLTTVVVEASESGYLLTSATKYLDFETLDGFSTWFSPITWNAGEEGIKSFYVPIINDVYIESDETMKVEIVSRDFSILDYCTLSFGICDGILTIKDDDAIATPPPAETVSDSGGGGGGGAVSPLILMNIVFLICLMRLHATGNRLTSRQHKVKM